MTPGAAFQRRVTWTVTVLLWPCVAIVILYMLGLVRLPPSHLRIFLECLLASIFALGPILHVVYSRLYGPIVRALDRHARGEATLEELREGFRRVVELPRALFTGGMSSWGGGGLLVMIATLLRAPDIEPLSLASLLVGLVSGGFVAEIFVFLLVKRVVEPERLLLAEACGDPDAREGLVRPFGVGRKLAIAVTGAMLVALVTAALFAQASASRASERWLAQVQSRLLSRAAADGAALAALRDEARELGVASEVVLLDASSLEVREGAPVELSAAELASIATSAEEAGDGSAFDSPHAFAWRRLPDGAGVLVAMLSGDVLVSESGGARIAFFAVLGLSALVALGVALALASDLGRAARFLEAAAGAMAGGDLRAQGRVYDAEDELGALGRAFGRMRRSLRGMVRGVAESADRVDAAASEIATAAGRVGALNRDQVGAIRGAGDSMDSIHRGVKGIADSAHELSHAVDESATSVHQLDAAGRELHRTAAALSGRVDTVSSAVEEMAASVREVARSAEALADAARDTSSSTEEMATSVREVEVHASESARLSGRAVGAAERGRERVAQTVAGMEAIRNETESARQVMTALGVRASEIGRILEVIDDVADRTSLLALNAAIISAQAGEHGRAFAVVADEIRSLAERVRESTREIEARVRAVQSAATDAASAIERGALRVQEGVTLSAEAGDSLDEITSVARENGERMEGIVSAIREQAKAAAHVAELMDQLQAGVERIRRASQEQDRGNELILGEVVDMRGASERVSATAREQEAGTARIRDAYEGVRGAVERIAAALQEQSQACSRSAELLVEMNQRTGASEASVGSMGEATGALAAEAEALRAAVGRFQL